MFSKFNLILILITIGLDSMTCFPDQGKWSFTVAQVGHCPRWPSLRNNVFFHRKNVTSSECTALCTRIQVSASKVRQSLIVNNGLTCSSSFLRLE